MHRAVVVHLHDVGSGHRCRRYQASKAIILAIMSHADMTEAIDHALNVEDVIGADEVRDQRG